MPSMTMMTGLGMGAMGGREGAGRYDAEMRVWNEKRKEEQERKVDMTVGTN